MKDPFQAFSNAFLKQQDIYLPQLMASNSKIGSLDNTIGVSELTLAPSEIEELEEFHPLFAKCALAMTIVMPLCYMALTIKEFKKHRKMIDIAEAQYLPEDPFSPVFDSYFTMWTLFDAEVEKTGKVLADVVKTLKFPLKIDEDTIDLIERMKATYPGIYICEEKLSELFLVREIPSGRLVEAVLEPGLEEVVEEENILMVRLIEDVQEGTHVQLSSPYIIQSTEDDWREFFADQGIKGGKPFDLNKYRTFMKKGKFPGFWMHYVNTTCLSVNDMSVTLDGTPVLSALAATF